MEETKVVWHPYPEVRPQEDKYYLVTIKHKHTKAVTTWDSVNGIFYTEWDVTAWAELPEPYEEKV